MCKQDQDEVQQKLCDYMAQDLAVHKMQVNEYKKYHIKLIALVIIMAVLVIASVVGFAATVYFITKQQTEQIHAIFGSNWEKTFTIHENNQDEHIYQEGGDGGLHNPIINYKSSGNKNTITANAGKSK